MQSLIAGRELKQTNKNKHENYEYYENHYENLWNRFGADV